jgi:hypothetical protein|tara:strand:- start:7197 stop:8285 length:1089 start_codon:yes stop_codon:yes gene_type:complete
MNRLENLPVVVIGTFGHCASDWLGNLLDSHKQVLITPGLAYFRTLNLLKKKKINFKTFNNTKIISMILKNILIKSPWESYNFFLTSKKKKKFKEYLKFYLKKSKEKNVEKKIFLAINFAYAKSNKIDLNKIKVIITHEHTPWNCKYYTQYFDTKFLFIVRDPRATFAGSFKTFDKYPTFAESYKMDIVLSFWIAAFNFVLNYNPKKTYVIKNEKINRNLKPELIKLSKWLGIKFSPSLLKPTHLGKKWYGDSSYLAKFELKKSLPKNYYKESNVKKRWKRYLDKRTILTIEVVLKNIMKKYNYQPENDLNLRNTFKGYFNLFFSYNNSSSFLREFIGKIKNSIRRIFILLNHDIARKLFDIN